MTLDITTTLPAQQQSPAAIVHVIEQNPAVLDTIRNALASMGADIRSYTSAEAFLAEQPTSPTECLITALQLPDINGVDLLSELRQRGRQLPVILLSSDADVATAVRAMREGASDFIQKPLIAHRLLRSVQQMLSRATHH